MAEKSLINLGIAPDSGTGDSARRGGEKINRLFADVYANFGDNPIITNPNDPLYGTRKVFNELEYKVGELQPAGKFSTVTFTDSDYGLATHTPGSASFSEPLVRQSMNWYFLSRGEAVTLDLDSDKVGPTKGVNLVLPLAFPGDTIKVRDSFQNWKSRKIFLWTTPYEDTLDTDEWLARTPNATKIPDADCVRIAYVDSNNLQQVKKHVPFKRTTFTGTDSEQLPLQNVGSTELEFVYQGPSIGWFLSIKFGFTSFKAELANIDSDNEAFKSGLRGYIDTNDSELRKRVTSHDSDIDAIYPRLSTVETTATLLKQRSDSDTIRIQSLSTSVTNLNTTVTHLLYKEDSDAKEIIDLWSYATNIAASQAASLIKADSDWIRREIKRLDIDSDWILAAIAAGSGSGLVTHANLVSALDSERDDWEKIFQIITAGSPVQQTYKGTTYPSLRYLIDSEMKRVNTLSVTVRNNEITRSTRDDNIEARTRNADSDANSTRFEKAINVVLVDPIAGPADDETLVWDSNVAWDMDRYDSERADPQTTFYRTGGWVNKTVWGPHNDGSGSGLDADLLDGKQSATANTADTVVLRDASGNFAANEVTATIVGKFKTARKINNTDFDGSAAITTDLWGTSREIKIGDTLKEINGSTNYTWTITDIIPTSTNLQLGGLGVGTSASSGEVRATGNITAYYSSDIKFKENVKEVEDALEIVSKIGSKTFDWTEDYIASRGGEDGYFVQKSDFGVIAQDVQKVFPQAVRTREDGSLAVDYEKLGTLAFGAINQLLKRVEALEAK